MNELNLEIVKAGVDNRYAVRYFGKPGMSRSEAEKILRRCDCHDELVAALEGFMNAWITPKARSMHQLKTDMDNAYKQGDIALAGTNTKGIMEECEGEKMRERKIIYCPKCKRPMEYCGSCKHYICVRHREVIKLSDKDLSESR